MVVVIRKHPWVTPVYWTTLVSSSYAERSQIRDRQVSLCLGMPMIINDDDCTLEALTVEDFPSEPRETAQYIIGQASLSRAG